MKKIDHFRSWSPETKMVVIFGILDPENPRNQPKTKFSPKLKIDPETLKFENSGSDSKVPKKAQS